MKTLHNTVLAIGLALASTTAITAVPAAAQMVRGIATANPEAAVVNSNAFKTAAQQRPITFKPQYDAAIARRQQIEAQLEPLVQRFNTDRQAPNASQPAAQQALQQQVAQIQRIQEVAQQELNEIMMPVALSEQYVIEQIAEKLEDATQRAMTRRGITIVLTKEAVIKANDTYSLDADITAELNALLPSAQLVAPPGWLPRAQRDAAAAQAAAQQGAQPAAPAATDGR